MNISAQLDSAELSYVKKIRSVNRVDISIKSVVYLPSAAAWQLDIKSGTLNLALETVLQYF